ncbi:hypothetical protein HYG81_21360 (plasmid) [Natrinema zhouii]|uniref:hypothetical protein n=1 Tax=Natrinema zhouii TaxID=1710539 RepID=UPI001CFF9DB2|nr:hypothetical protein [Natrinema zhouii]UHQ98129.1 hypothetical protein HYG81_21360 [Natrinema zhouii]
MVVRINVEDEAAIELSNIDVTVYGDSIEFSVDGTISEVPDEILTELSGEQLSPVEISFRQK